MAIRGEQCSPSDMKVLMWKAVFEKYDKNNDGDLTLEEMKPVFKKVFVDVDHDKLIAKMDQDGDGKITRKEFVQAMLPMSRKKAVEVYFHAMDDDDSAYLDVEEFKKAMMNLGIVNPKLLQNLQRVADNDNNKKISIREFMKFFDLFAAK